MLLRSAHAPLLAMAVPIALLGLTVLSSVPDLAVADYYYNPATKQFWLWADPLANGVHRSLTAFGCAAGIFCAISAAWLVFFSRHAARGGRAMALLFVLASLLTGPALLVNEVVKTNSGRARPIHLARYSGEQAARYTAPLAVARACRSNCSFVSGDAALGFWVHSLVYVLPKRRQRRLALWGGLGLGAGIGWLRVAMGAHFVSDVLFAGALILASSLGTAAAMFGWRTALSRLFPGLALPPPRPAAEPVEA